MQIYLPPGFDRDAATYLATLIDTAYDMCAQWEAQQRPAAADFHWTPQGPTLSYSAPVWGSCTLLAFFSRAEPFAYVAHSPDGLRGYVVFRGTQTPQDALSDLRAGLRDFSRVPAYGQAHEGFVEVYDTLSAALLAAVAALPASVEQLWVCGHSMGSAFSTLAIPDLLAHSRFGPAQLLHVNLASPRVASTAFAGAYAENGVQTYRVVNTCDLVPELPPAVLGEDLYQHVGIPVDFTLQRGSIDANHSARDSYRHALETARILT